jgi:flagellar capping protein FliD
MNSPSKLEILQKINELISAYNSLRNSVQELTDKLNDDTGLSDTDYSDSSNIAPLNLSAEDSLINRR